MRKLSKTQKKSKKTVQLPTGQRSTQEWLPIKDVNNDMTYRRDNHIVKGVRIEPLNLHLLSDKEKAEKISALHEVLNGVDYEHQTLAIPKPVDLDGYITGMTEMKNEETHFLKKKLLDGYIRQAAILATGGEALERQFYIFISQELSKKVQQDEYELTGRATELANNLTSSGLVSTVCNDQDLRDVSFVFLNPQQAAYERSPETSNEYVSALYEGV